ncbi:MAG: hypothetical protein ACOYM3_18975, partial [Terrimicrobiaceae bacterium]
MKSACSFPSRKLGFLIACLLCAGSAEAAPVHDCKLKSPGFHAPGETNLIGSQGVLPAGEYTLFANEDLSLSNALAASEGEAGHSICLSFSSLDASAGWSRFLSDQNPFPDDSTGGNAGSIRLAALTMCRTTLTRESSDDEFQRYLDGIPQFSAADIVGDGPLDAPDHSISFFMTDHG